MEIIIVILSLYGGYALWKGFSKGGLANIHIPFVTNRGLLAVQAATYLLLLSNGKQSEEANVFSQSLDENMPTEIILRAMDFIKTEYGGSQMSMIAEARARGFEQ